MRRVTLKHAASMKSRKSPTPSRERVHGPVASRKHKASVQEAVRSGQLRKKEKSTGKLDLTAYPPARHHHLAGMPKKRIHTIYFFPQLLEPTFFEG